MWLCQWNTCIQTHVCNCILTEASFLKWLWKPLLLNYVYFVYNVCLCLCLCRSVCLSVCCIVLVLKWSFMLHTCTSTILWNRTLWKGNFLISKYMSCIKPYIFRKEVYWWGNIWHHKFNFKRMLTVSLLLELVYWI